MHFGVLSPGKILLFSGHQKDSVVRSLHHLHKFYTWYSLSYCHLVMGINSMSYIHCRNIWNKQKQAVQLNVKIAGNELFWEPSKDFWKEGEGQTSGNAAPGLERHLLRRRGDRRWISRCYQHSLWVLWFYIKWKPYPSVCEYWHTALAKCNGSWLPWVEAKSAFSALSKPV